MNSHCAEAISKERAKPRLYFPCRGQAFDWPTELKGEENATFRTRLFEEQRKFQATQVNLKLDRFVRCECGSANLTEALFLVRHYQDQANEYGLARYPGSAKKHADECPMQAHRSTIPPLGCGDHWA